ncbi:MAG: SigE family RNA polymerase sigma factor [Sporichthyaceae bacterium]
MTQERDAEFSAFVAGHERGLRRTAWLACGDVHRADDVVQTVLTRLYLRWSRLDRREDLLSYARRAVLNAALDERRRPYRRREVTTAELPDVPAGTFEGHAEDQLALLAAIATLPPGQRSVVVLRFAEGLDVEETARVLGIATGTVKSQSAKGLAALRARLGPRFAPSEESRP